MRFMPGKSAKAVLIGLACWFLPLRPVQAQSPTPNLNALKGEMKVYEAVIDGTMAQTFSPPFGLLEKTQGTYLPGFGLAFTLEVNLYPLRTPYPFNVAPLTKAEIEKAQKVKRERIATVKESIPRLLADHAICLRDLNSDESVAVVVHLFEVEPGDTGLPDQLVIETRKADLNQYWERKIPYQELVAKIKILEI